MSTPIMKLIAKNKAKYQFTNLFGGSKAGKRR